MILCALLALIANVVANRMAIRTSRNVIIQLRHDLFEKALQLSSSQTDRLTIPSLISRLTTDTYNVHQLLDNMQRLLIRAPILLLGGLVITALLEPVLTLILIAALPFLGLVIWYTTRIGVPMYTEAQTALDRLIRTVQENIHGVRVIKALSKGDYEIAKFDQSNRDLIQKEQRAGITMAVTNPGMNFDPKPRPRPRYRPWRLPCQRRFDPAGKDRCFLKLYHHHHHRPHARSPSVCHLFKGLRQRQAHCRGSGNVRDDENWHARPCAWPIPH